MRLSERIKIIEAILLRQVDYLAGCQFRVTVQDPSKETFRVTFEKMTNFQLQQLRRKLQEYSLEHIEIVSKQIIEGKDPDKHFVGPTRKNRRRKRSHGKRP